MRTVGWVDPAAEVKANDLEQAEEPAPVLVEEPEAVEEAEEKEPEAEEPEEPAAEEKKPAKKATSKKK